MTLSVQSKRALLVVNVAASQVGAEIIGASHAAYYMEGNVGAGTLLHQIDTIREALPKLVMAIAELDKVVDELNGREPPVVVDEQEAA